MMFAAKAIPTVLSRPFSAAIFESIGRPYSMLGSIGMADAPLYVGIDLGTTNSAAAVFDGERVSVVRNAQGASVTPSVVRIDKQGRITVGTRARRFVEPDAANTAAEFKRLMGTERAIEFPASGQKRKPEELSAEILKALRQDIQDQLGVAVERAVI